MNCKNCIKQGCSLAGKDHEMSFDCKLYVNGSAYKYDNFKADPPRMDDGWYLVKDGMTYRVEVPINKMRFTKSVNILTGEVYYPSNADRIRSMTDEELDKFLGEVQWDVANYCGGVTQKQEYPVPEQRGAWLDWLKEEAKDD